MKDEIIIEFTRVGNYLRATAMDSKTLIEVTSMGPLHSREMLKRTVLAKLDYVIKNRKPKNF